MMTINKTKSSKYYKNHSKKTSDFISIHDKCTKSYLRSAEASRGEGTNRGKKSNQQNHKSEHFI